MNERRESFSMVGYMDDRIKVIAIGGYERLPNTINEKFSSVEQYSIISNKWSTLPLINRASNR